MLNREGEVTEPLGLIGYLVRVAARHHGIDRVLDHFLAFIHGDFDLGWVAGCA